LLISWLAVTAPVGAQGVSGAASADNGRAPPVIQIPAPTIQLPAPEAKGENPPVPFMPPATDGTETPVLEGKELVLPAAPDGCPGCEAKKKEDKGQDGPMHVLAKLPVRIFPPPGFPFVFPSGPGYYSALDWLRGEYREKPPNFPYSPVSIMPKSFFDADFRYLASPTNTQHDIFDPLHTIFFGHNNDWYFSTGGEFRYRYMHEIDSRLSGKDQSYDLLRTRVYGDLWYQDRFRVYVEFLDAQAFRESLAYGPLDRDKSDLLNAFIDYKIADIADYPLYIRAGRQELLLGSQRLVSPLDWANTRRTFEGFRLFRQGEKFDVDVFLTQPVIPNASHFDSVNDHANFGGAWFTYRPMKKTFIDAYYLFYDNNRPAVVLGETKPVPFDTNTLGSRYYGEKGNWMWDLEGAVQLGTRETQDIVAGMGTAGGGYHFCQLPWNPTFWAYYDYASGNRHPGTGGTYSTFNELFPFNHYYFGSIDLVGRQNIHDLNCHLYLYPQNWITFWGQYHHYWLASPDDALYNSAGVAIRRSPNGSAGTNVGDEVHFLTNFHLDAHSDLLIGYAHLFSGSFIRQTGPPGDSELFYVQYSFRW
jgi:hypothetical protein